MWLTLLTNKYVLGALLVLALIAGGWMWHAGKVHEAVLGERHEWETKIAAANAERDQEIAAWKIKEADLNTKLETKTTEKVVEVRTVTKEVVHEIPVYIPSTLDVNLGFVLIHNAAAEGKRLPDSPSGPVDKASGIGLPRVAETVANNYAECRVWREQVIGWQEWYENQHTEWNAHK
jgi:hypothetical protein